jgi:predicted MFS family arabinose efflux permease
LSGRGSSEAPERNAPGARTLLALLTAAYVLNFLDRQALAILVEPIKRELGVSDARMGLLVGASFTLAYTGAGLIFARWIDRGPRVAILAGGLALWSAMTMLAGFATSFAHLALTRIGVGVGESVCSPAAHSLLADAFAPKRRASAIALYSSGIYVGITLAFLFGGDFGERLGWRTTLMVLGAPGIVVALAMAASIRDPRRSWAPALGFSSEAASTAEARDRGAGLHWLRDFSPAWREMALGAAVKSIAGYALISWSASFLERVHSMPLREVGLWLGLTNGVGGFLGSLVGGLLADRLGARDPRWRLRVGALATLASLPFLYAFLYAPTAQLALAANLAGPFLGAMYLGPVFAMGQSLAPPHLRARSSAALLFVINLIGLGLGPWLAGALSDRLAPTQGAASIRTALAIVGLSYAWGAAHLWRASSRT